MIIHFLAWVFIVFCSLGVSKLFGKSDSRPMDFAIFRGLILIAGLLSWVNLFAPISLPVQLGLLLTAGVGWLKGGEVKPIRGKNGWLTILSSWGGLIPAAFLFLLLSAQVPLPYDTYLYHAQAILWKQDFEVVPGLGNLHGRLAFNSSSFFLNALFSFGRDLSYPLHSLLFLMLLGRFWANIRILPDLRNLAFHLPLFSVAFLTLIFRGLSSPAADTLSVIALIYLALSYRASWLGDSGIDKGDLILMSFFCFTIKLSMVLIPFLGVYLVFRSPALWRTFLGWGLFLIGPFLITNYIQTGYLLYPSPALDLFNPDWKIPIETVNWMRDLIESWAKNPGGDPAEVLRQGIGEWLPLWFPRNLLRDRAMLILFAITLFPLLLRSRRLTPQKIIILTVITGSIFFWLLNAPDFRFGYGFFALYFAFFMDALFPESLAVVIRRPALRLIAGSVVLLLFAVNLGFLAGLQDFWMRPARVPEVEVRATDLNGIEFRSPVSGDLCANTPIPCAPGISSSLRMRGASLGQGFRIER